VSPYDDPGAVADMTGAIIAADLEFHQETTTMGALAKAEPVSGEVIQTNPNTIMEVISRAAADPNTDVDKLERLLQMYERISDRDAKAAYAAALSEMQPKLPVINERGKISTDKGKTTQSRYALWEDINEAIGPVLAEHGFGLSFRTGQTAEGKITVTGILSHRGGHQEETLIILPHDSSGNKNAVQAVGSSTSYGKRYTAMALLNITSRGEDDDGKAGGDPGGLTEDQQADVQALMEDVGADRERFLKYIKADSIAAIPAASFDKVMKTLEAKRGKA
jgi:hypothetical protein